MKNQDVDLTESNEYCVKPLVEIGNQIVTIIDKRIVEKLHIKGNLLVSQSITKDGSILLTLVSLEAQFQFQSPPRSENDSINDSDNIRLPK